MPELTDADWGEIYYALLMKQEAVQQGKYGDDDADLNQQEWYNHLGAIIDKIGPDGENMYKGGD
jgi:hypothetical protein